MKLKPFDAYLMFVQTNSTIERNKLLPIIFSDQSVALSFMRTKIWNYEVPYRLFIKALKIVLNSNDPKLIIHLIKDDDVFLKLSRRSKIEIIKKFVYFYEHDILKDIAQEGLELLLSYSYKEKEQEMIFNYIYPLVEQDIINLNTYLKFCVLFSNKLSEKEIWKLIYKATADANIKIIKFLLNKGKIPLNKEMVETLESSFIDNKLRGQNILSFFSNNNLNFLKRRTKK